MPNAFDDSLVPSGSGALRVAAIFDGVSVFWFSQAAKFFGKNPNAPMPAKEAQMIADAFCKSRKAHHYKATEKKFSVFAAIEEAKAAGKTVVLCESTTRSRKPSRSK